MTKPYYIVPLVEKYKSLDPNSEEAKRLARIITANVGDYASLRLILGIDPPEFAKFYPDMETASPTTLDTIDAFLDKFGGKYNEDVAPMPDSVSQIPENPSVAIENIERENKEENKLKKEISDLKLLLNSHRYMDAMKLIEAQNLNNPQKSIYFAHQMRFLKKLIAIDNFRKQTHG